MPSILVEPYVIRLRAKHKKKNKVDFKLDTFGGAQDDLFEVLKRYFGGYVNTARKLGLTQAAKITAYQNNSRVIKGRMNIGDYGRSSQIVDVDTGQQNYLKLTTDADLTPYYFAFHIPKGKTAGLAILQRIGKGGIRTAIENLIAPNFQDQFEDTQLNINPLAPEEALQDALKNQIREVSFVQHSIPADLTDKFVPGKNSPGKFIVTVKTERAMPKINSWFKKKINGKSEIADLLEMEYFEPDSVKATLQLGDKQRVIEVSDRVRFKPSFDISDDVDIGVDGYAKFSSIDEVCTEIATNLLEVVK